MKTGLNGPFFLVSPSTHKLQACDDTIKGQIDCEIDWEINWQRTVRLVSKPLQLRKRLGVARPVRPAPSRPFA